jgi:hypothetical protein
MAGGAGVEWYLGSTEVSDPNGAPGRRWWDLETEDWRAHDRLWTQTRHALEFFKTYLPFWEMRPDDFLATSDLSYCLAKKGETYSVYLPRGGTTSLDLGSQKATYEVRWYDPRNGGSLQSGSVTSVDGPGVKALGKPPESSERDWVVLVRRIR